MRSFPRWASFTTALLATLAAGVSVAGIAAPGVYRDTPLVRSGWLGNDLVTLFVAVPLLVLAARRAASGSLPAQLVWLGMLDYLVYDFAFYLFGAVLNPLFLAYAALVGGSAVLLVAGLVALDVGRLAGVAAARPLRGVVAWLAVVALTLGSLWTVTLFRAGTSATPPDDSIELLHLIGSLDLTMVVPLHALAAVLLAMRRPWGLALAAVANVKSAVYMPALAAATLTAWGAGTVGDPSQALVWIATGVCALASGIAVLRAVAGSVPTRTPDGAISPTGVPHPPR